MLSSLSIKNYALIENLQVDFQNGLSIITGETGAGKSILLGGLALVLGKRANASLVKNKDKKCVIEVEFAIENYHLEGFFEEEDLDFEPVTTLRREILPNGKSRAFVNDTPTTLQVLSALSERLIDIHSQHETLQLADSYFQFQIIDALADNNDFLNSYTRGLKLLVQKKKVLKDIEAKQNAAKEQYDFHSFLLQELQEAKLIENEQEELEDKLDKISHIEEIKLSLSESLQIAENEEVGLRNLLQKIKNNLSKIASYDTAYASLFERINSAFIEFDDITAELESENDALEFSPEELEKTNDRLQLIYTLQKKHKVETVAELLEIQQKIESEILSVDNAEEAIKTALNEINQVQLKLDKLAVKIRKRREKAIPDFQAQLQDLLEQLEMKNTRFSIQLAAQQEFLSNGKDTLEFLISADRGAHFESLKKAASGGEMSRIMLAVKCILSKYTKLPTVIFDEIDTGVSGEVSNRIAEVMQQMSKNMQVISITHLPQIAAKGNQHYKVYKEDRADAIHSNIKKLTAEERVVEIAEMLSGKDISATAITHAKELLN